MELNSVQNNPSVLHGYAFNHELNQLEPVEHFPFEEVFRDLDGEAPPESEPGADELRDLLQSVWAGPGDLAAARARFKAMAKKVLKSEPPASRGAAGFARLVQWCFSRRGTNETAWNFFVALSATVNPQLVGGRDYADLARELGKCKAAVSANAQRFRRAFGFAANQWRSAEGRANMKAARLRQLSRC